MTPRVLNAHVKGDLATVRMACGSARGEVTLVRDVHGTWCAPSCDPADWISEGLYERVMGEDDLFGEVLPAIEHAAAVAVEALGDEPWHMVVDGGGEA